VNTFIVLKFLTQLLTPIGLMVIGLLAGTLLTLVRLPRLGRAIAALGIAQAVLLSLSPIADALLLPLEDEARKAAAAAPPCCYDAIVVLGAGVVTAAPPLRPDPELTDSSDRLWYAARLYHRGIAPRIVVSGGSYAAQRGGPMQTEGEAMREVLLALGVPEDRIVLEGRSLNTIDNMREIRALVGTGRIALVTSGYHMPRAMRLAREAHLNAEAFPTDWRIVRLTQPEWLVFLPSVDAMWNATIALREYVALAFDRRGEGPTP
jgi:uncharacterized SAM-binding protein YcdF (DUF218 family)